MTHLEKSVRRTISVPRHGDLVTEISREGVRMREKGRRTWYGPFPWGKLFVSLARMEADRKIAERKARRKAKHQARHLTRSA